MKRYYFILTLLFLQINIFNAFNLNAQDTENLKVFKAGAATSNITPNLGDFIIGNFGTPEATYVHDEIHAKSLALDDGENKLIFVIVELLGLNHNLINDVKKNIQEKTNISPNNILISAVHNHSATSAQSEQSVRDTWRAFSEPYDDYQKFVIKRLTDVALIALENLEPAKIGWGGGNVPEHVFVRRWKMKEPVLNPFGEMDKVVMNPGRNANQLEPASEPDPEVSFISVKAKDGRPIALLANYSLHYVGGVPNNHISGDYFAAFADRIQELLVADRQHPSFVGILSNGTSGNVNNINFAIPAVKVEPYSRIKVVSNDLAQEVFRVEKNIQYHDWVPLEAKCENLKLKVRKPDEKTLLRAKEILNRPDTVKPLHSLEVPYAVRSFRIMEWPDYIDVPIQAFKIGDLGVGGVPFEVFSETGVEIKEKSPFKKTFTIELANGYFGYLPPPEQHELGGYETWYNTNKVEKQASVKIVSKLMNMFQELK